LEKLHQALHTGWLAVRAVYKVIAFEKFPNGFQFSVMRFSSALSCDQAGRCSHEQQEAAGNVCDRVKVDPRGHEERRRFVMA
jgi:hypothetical protein